MVDVVPQDIDGTKIISQVEAFPLGELCRQNFKWYRRCHGGANRVPGLCWRTP